MTSPWVVHSYHINIGPGDSAVHLLCEPRTDGRFTVQRAVLIDGGKPKNNLWPAIWTTVEKISNDPSYFFPDFPGAAPPTLLSNTRHRLQFDAVMITHWDDDHFGGILASIKNDLVWQVAELADPAKMTAAAKEAAQASSKTQNRNLVADLRPSFFKYTTTVNPQFLSQMSDDDRDKWTVRPAECLTTVYVPCPPTKGHNIISPKASLSWNNASLTNAYANDDYKVGVINTLDFKFDFNTIAGGFEDGWNGFKTLGIAKVIASYRDFLGCEVFYTTRLGTNNEWQDITTPQLLIEKHLQLRHDLNAAGHLANIPPEGSPMMFIVGGGIADADSTNSSIVIGNIPPAKPAGRKIHVDMIDGFKGNTALKAPGSSRTWTSNEKNSLSMMCVVMSPVFSETRASGTFETKDFALRHFFAGDALWPTETALAQWLSRKRDGTTFKEGNTAPCAIMKISHHGGSESTSVALLKVLQPEKVVVSNAEAHGWGHPLFLLHALWAGTYDLGRARGDQLESRLYTTYFPDYFDGKWTVDFKDDDSFVGVTGFSNSPSWAFTSLTHADEQLDDDGNFPATDLDPDPVKSSLDFAWVEDLARRYEALGWIADRRNIFARMKKEDTGNSLSLRQRCIRWMYEIWSDISNITATYSVTEKQSVNPSGIFTRERNALGHFKCEIAATGTVNVIAFSKNRAPLLDLNPYLFSVEQGNFSKRPIGGLLHMTHPLVRVGTPPHNGMQVEATPKVEIPPKSRKRRQDEIVQSTGGIDRVEVAESAGLYASPPSADDIVQPSKLQRNNLKALPMDFDIESEEIPEANVDPNLFWYEGYPDYTGDEFDFYYKTHGKLPPPKVIERAETASDNWPFDPMPLESSHDLLAPSIPIRIRAVVAEAPAAEPPPPMTAVSMLSSAYDHSSMSVAEAVLSGSMNDYVACLKIGALALQAPPVWSKDLDAYVADIKLSDEWMSSLLGSSLGLYAASISINASTSNAGTFSISAVSFTARNPGKAFAENDDTTDGKWGLVFDTKSNLQQFMTSDWIVQPHNILVMGLNPSSVPTEILFSDFAAAFGLPGGRLLGIAEDFASMTNPNVFKLTLDRPSSDSKARPVRNGLFIQADSRYTTTLRLQFSADGLQAKLNDLLSPVKTTVSDIKVIGKKVSRSHRAGPNVEARTRAIVAISATASLGSATASAWLVFGGGSVKVVIRPASASLDAILKWCGTLFDSAKAGGDDVRPSSALGNDACADLELLEVELTLVKDLTTGRMRLDSLDVDFALKFKPPRQPVGKSKSAAFFLSFSYPQMRFRGSLWPSEITAPPITKQWLSPDYEEYTCPPMPSFQDPLLITDFLPNDAPDLPHGLPTAITRLSLDIVKNSQVKSIAFGCTLQCLDVQAQKGEVPRVVLDVVTVDISYITVSAAKPLYNVSFSAVVTLKPRENGDVTKFVPLNLRSGFSPASMSVGVSLTSEGWSLRGQVLNLEFATLYSLIDPDYNQGVMDMLEHFSLKDLLVTYQHSKTGAASSLNLAATLELGPFELDLLYTSASADPSDLKNNPASWSITAWLGKSSTTGTDPYTVGDLIQDLVGPGTDMRDVQGASFIADIPVPFVNSGSSIADSLIAFEVLAVGKGLLMWTRLRLTESIHVTLIQLQGDVPEGEPRPQPKRIILVSADTLPTLQTIPVVNKLPQPFDQLDYVWVQDNNGTGENAGLTRAEVDQVNLALVPTGQILPFKDVSKQDNKPTGGSVTPMAILAGHHFMVSRQSHVVLDYVFGRKAPAPASGNPPRQALAITNSNRRLALNNQDSVMNSPDAGATKATAKFSLGPIAISSIGLQYKAGKLWVLVDATVSLGPIQLTLIGFGIQLDLSKIKLHELKTLVLAPSDIMIHGVSVDFNKPPVLVAGVFIHENDDTVEIFKGGIALAIQPYMLLAVGAYKHYKNPDFKSVFIYARLDGPLVELEFGEISGVRAGFGYNNSLSVPMIADVDKFPLVFDSDAMNANSNTNDPMQVLQAFGPYQHDQEGTFWVAAGMKVTAFQSVSITAVILVSFDPLPMLAIVGQAVASMPPKVPDPRLSFLYVKLGVIATLDIPHGSLRVEAQLANDSFVLNPFVHLSGGAALCYWFQGSGHEGDWVFTVGGYHRQFNPPNHYPNPPRVRISWSFDDLVSISGEAYFAITPRVAMGGGRLAVLFSANPLYADLEAWADFLIQFKPFYMMADIGVSVGVEFTLDLWLVTIHISIHVGAQVHLEGPEFGGWVYVDFYLFGFTVHFGAPTHAAMAIELNEFLAMIKEPGPGHARTISDKSSATGTHDFTLTLVAGEIAELSDSMHNAADDAQYIWPVRGGQFKFRIETKFPVRKITLTDQGSPQHTAQVTNGPAMFSRPMWVETAITTSDLTIAIDNDSENGWQIEAITKQMPAAVWGPYSDSVDPRKPGDKTKSLLPSSGSDQAASPATIDLWAGVTIKSPKPKLSVDIVPAINAQALMHASVYETVADNPVLIDKAKAQNQAYQPTDVNIPGASTDPWERVREEWVKTDKVDDRKAMAQMAAWALGWDTAAQTMFSPPVTSVATSNDREVYRPLVAKVPSTLVKDAGAFDVYFMEAPVMT